MNKKLDCTIDFGIISHVHFFSLLFSLLGYISNYPLLKFPLEQPPQNKARAMILTENGETNSKFNSISKHPSMLSLYPFVSINKHIQDQITIKEEEINEIVKYILL